MNIWFRIWKIFQVKFGIKNESLLKKDLVIQNNSIVVGRARQVLLMYSLKIIYQKEVH